MLSVFSPAKINLFLRVLGKRLDGYHELSTLMQTISLGDTLHFQLDEYDSLSCTDAAIPTDTSNLVLKAASLFRRKTGVKLGLKIHLNKHIPTQAGLGGGSSNAATTLWAFNELTGKGISLDELKAWSSEIGSDIPFFFSQGTAHCTGRGEKVLALPNLPSRSCWIVKPSLGLSTPDVYQRLRLNKVLEIRDGQDLELFFTSTSHYFNDLEQPAFEIRPELQELKIFLSKRGFETVLLAGSGSAFFCLGTGEVPVYPHIFSFCARFLNREPFSWYKSN